MENIYLLKIIGQRGELFVTILEETEQYYIVKNPLIFDYVNDGQQQGFAFIEWFADLDNTQSIKISKTGVIAIASPSNNMKKQYIIETSGIAIATHI